VIVGRCVVVVLFAVLAEGPASGDWSLPNLSRASTRAAVGSPITADSVGQLRVLWRFRFTGSAVTEPMQSSEGLRGVVATPIVAGDTVYVQDATSAVYALDLATGALRWEHRFHADNFGRNGLSYSSGSIYGSTDTTVFALSAATGRMLWQRRLVTSVEQYVDIAPLIANNLVYTSTVGYPPGGRGAIYALSAHTGAIVWRFSTIRGPWSHPADAGGGGAWYTPSIDGQGNLYVGVANPYPLGGSRAQPNGGAFPGRALYTDSLIVLDGQTGALRWFDQVTAHDIRDYDFQLPPILATLAIDGTLRNIVFGAGKAGVVVAWDRDSHQRLWQTLVGQHRNDTGPLPAHTITICPGFFGGIETPMAYTNDRLFVPIVNLCAYGSAHGYQAIATLNPIDGTGEFLSLDATTGHILWKRTLPQPDFGCATVASGVVFTSTFDGRIYGLDTQTGATLWSARAPAGINGCPALTGSVLVVPAGSATTKIAHPSYELIAYARRSSN
jgi:outer membrane protein assembly factor BamB